MIYPFVEVKTLTSQELERPCLHNQTQLNLHDIKLYLVACQLHNQPCVVSVQLYKNYKSGQKSFLCTLSHARPAASLCVLFVIFLLLFCIQSKIDPGMLKRNENPTPLGVVTGMRRTALMKPEAWRFEECIDAEWASMPDAKRL